MATTNQKSNIISAARQQITVLLDTAAQLHTIVQRANDLGLVAVGPNQLVDADFIGSNAGITAAAFLAALPVADGALRPAERQIVVLVRE